MAAAPAAKHLELVRVGAPSDVDVHRDTEPLTSIGKSHPRDCRAVAATTPRRRWSAVNVGSLLKGPRALKLPVT